MLCFLATLYLIFLWYTIKIDMLYYQCAWNYVVKETIRINFSYVRYTLTMNRKKKSDDSKNNGNQITAINAADGDNYQ